MPRVIFPSVLGRTVLTQNDINVMIATLATSTGFVSAEQVADNAIRHHHLAKQPKAWLSRDFAYPNADASSDVDTVFSMKRLHNTILTYSPPVAPVVGPDGQAPQIVVEALVYGSGVYEGGATYSDGLYVAIGYSTDEGATWTVNRVHRKAVGSALWQTPFGMDDPTFHYIFADRVDPSPNYAPRNIWGQGVVLSAAFGGPGTPVQSSIDGLMVALFTSDTTDRIRVRGTIDMYVRNIQ
jgi:hypothetical protein